MRGVVIGTICLAAFFIVGKVWLIADAHSHGKNMYEIEVVEYGREADSYTTYAYKFDENKCVTFKDALGIERTICGQVKITKY